MLQILCKDNFWDSTTNVKVQILNSSSVFNCFWGCGDLGWAFFSFAVAFLPSVYPFLRKIKGAGRHWSAPSKARMTRCRQMFGLYLGYPPGWSRPHFTAIVLAVKIDLSLAAEEISTTSPRFLEMFSHLEILRGATGSPLSSGCSYGMASTIFSL